MFSRSGALFLRALRGSPSELHFSLDVSSREDKAYLVLIRLSVIKSEVLVPSFVFRTWLHQLPSNEERATPKKGLAVLKR